MTSRRERFILSLGLGMLICLIAAPLQATVLVDDSWADGDLAKTGALDTNWWTSSSSSADEVSVGSMGLVTGTSGRGLHTIFPTVTLDDVGDAVKVSFTFTTPDTVGTNRSTALRFGLFDDLGRAGLNAEVNASSGSPNELYGWGLATGGPGTETIPGYMFDMDVNNGESSDLNFRQHFSSNITGTGRLMATTSGFNNVSPSGPDVGDVFVPNTEYSGMYIIGRKSATELQLFGSLDTPGGLLTYANSDDQFDSVEFDFFGMHVNSRTFGDSNTAGEPDNGLDFSNIKIEFLTGFAAPEPSSMVLLMGAFVVIPAMRRR